jgi:polyisoprenoid-binding protein YceI
MKYAVVLLPLVITACPDPVGDKPRATVEATPNNPTVAAAPTAGTPRFVITPETSKIEFVGAKVTAKHDGGFKKFTGFIDVTDPANVETAKVDLDIDMDSIWTDTAKLTGHLKTPDFFDVAQFPTARFVSSTIKKNSDGTVTLTGDLTLRGVTKRITFPATVTSTKEGATAKAEFGINRKDWGVMYPGKPDDLVKDEVLIKLDINAKPTP